MLELRPAQDTDIDFIVGLETRTDLSPFINAWPVERHLRALNDPDFIYFIAEEDGRREGFAFLNGLRSPNLAIQLCRLALAETGKGRGRAFCRLILKKVFEEFGAHRLYLDLFEDNQRAEHLYTSLGFQLEGVLRESERRGDTFRSTKLMSMLDREYWAGQRKL